MLDSAIENATALLLFGMIFLSAFIFLLFAALGLVLLLRRAWWILRHRTWRDVIVSAERRALGG